MKRLTDRRNDQNDRRLSCLNRCYNAGDCINCDSFENAVDRLADYEDAEEQGLLVRLPCKVGDTVWVVVKGVRVKEVVECVVNEISIDGHGSFAVLRRKSTPGVRWQAYYIECFGKTVFLTFEEAEAALAKKG